MAWHRETVCPLSSTLAFFVAALAVALIIAFFFFRFFPFRFFFLQQTNTPETSHVDVFVPSSRNVAWHTACLHGIRDATSSIYMRHDDMHLTVLWHYLSEKAPEKAPAWSRCFVVFKFFAFRFSCFVFRFV